MSNEAIQVDNSSVPVPPPSKRNYTSLGQMVKDGDSDALAEHLSKKDLKDLSYDDKENYKKVINQLLYHAVSRDNPKVVKVLMDNKADVDFSDMGGTNCIHVAAAELLIDNLKVMKEYEGVNFATEDLGGYGVLEYVCAKYEEDKEQPEKDKLFGVLHYLISNGVDVNHTDLSGKTVLFYAVDKGLDGLVDFLIDNGIDPTIKDSIHKSLACEFASEERNDLYEVVEKYTTEYELKVKASKVKPKM